MTSFSVVPLYERRKTPVADRGYCSGGHCIPAMLNKGGLNSRLATSNRWLCSSGSFGRFAGFRDDMLTGLQVNRLTGWVPGAFLQSSDRFAQFHPQVDS
jgi:hypothetical protein